MDAATESPVTSGREPQLLDLDKLDQRLMYCQILALARTIGTLDALPASALEAHAPSRALDRHYCAGCRPAIVKRNGIMRPWIM